MGASSRLFHEPPNKRFLIKPNELPYALVIAAVEHPAKLFQLYGTVEKTFELQMLGASVGTVVLEGSLEGLSWKPVVTIDLAAELTPEFAFWHHFTDNYSYLRLRIPAGAGNSGSIRWAKVAGVRRALI